MGIVTYLICQNCYREFLVELEPEMDEATIHSQAYYSKVNYCPFCSEENIEVKEGS